MANKIVIYPKGMGDGAEYPLDADTGTDGKGILWLGGGIFLVTITTSIKLYRLDRASSTAIYQDLTIASGMVSVQSVTFDGRLIWPFGQTASGARNKWGWRIVDRAGNNAADLLVDNFGASSPAGYGVRDTSFDGQYFWYMKHSGSGTVNVRDGYRMIDESTPFAVASGNTLAESKGLATSRFREGFWWATTESSVNYVQYVSFANNVFGGEKITLNNSGTMRCMDDCGAFLAFMYN